MANARQKWHYFRHNKSPHPSILSQLQTLAVSILCLPRGLFFARELLERTITICARVTSTALPSDQHVSIIIQPILEPRSVNPLNMTTSYQANQIRAQKRKLWCMQVAQLQKQQESHDPWYSSPVNILNMSLSSTQISLAPFDLYDLTATSPITKLHMDLLRRSPQSRWLAEDEPFYPNDLAADREAKWLVLSNAPSRWQGGNDAWILWTQYIPITTDRCSPRPNVDVIMKTHLPVTVRTLARDEQCIAYHQLHKTATPAQLTAYYALHCEQLDSARCCVARRKLESMKEPKYTSPARLFYRLDQAMGMTRGVRLPHRLERYYQAQRALLTDAEYRLHK